MIRARRSFLLGLGALVAAPAIVRPESIMPVSAPKLHTGGIIRGWLTMNGAIEWNVEDLAVTYWDPHRLHMTHVIVTETVVPWRVIDRINAGAIRASEIAPGQIRTEDFA